MRISDWSSDVCSSDLPEGGPAQEADRPLTALALGRLRLRLIDGRLQRPRAAPHQRQPDEADEQREGKAARAPRSEEHTSELQSLMRISYAVFCLKKKKIIHTNLTHHTHQPTN